MPRQATQIWSQNDQNRRIYIYIEYYEERKNLKDGSELAKKNKLKKKILNQSRFHMLPALPGVDVDFVGFIFAKSTRSPNSLSSGFEAFIGVP